MVCRQRAQSRADAETLWLAHQGCGSPDTASLLPPASLLGVPRCLALEAEPPLGQWGGPPWPATSAPLTGRCPASRRASHWSAFVEEGREAYPPGPSTQLHVGKSGMGFSHVPRSPPERRYYIPGRLHLTGPCGLAPSTGVFRCHGITDMTSWG